MMIVQDVEQLESQLTDLLDRYRTLQEEVLRLRRAVAERDAENRLLDQKLSQICMRLEQILTRLPYPHTEESTHE